MKTDRKDLQALAMLGLVMLFWAGNSIVGRAVRFDVPPFTLAFGRWTGAFLLVLPFAWAGLRKDWPAIKRGWPMILVLGLLGVAAFNAFLYQGLRYSTATNVLLIQAGIPALVVVLDRIIFGTRANPWQAGGVALSIVGVMVILFEGDPAAALRLNFGFGDLLALCSVVVWSFYTIFLRLRPAIAPASFIATTFFIGVVAMAPLAALEWWNGETVNFTLTAIGGIAYVAVFPSLVAYLIYNWVAGQLGPARAGQGITMMPLFGAVLSALILGESLYSYHFAGMVLILLGIMLDSLARRRKRATGAA